METVNKGRESMLNIKIRNLSSLMTLEDHTHPARVFTWNLNEIADARGHCGPTSSPLNEITRAW